MGNYSIKDLEHLSGIKAHTLRIWEQRYNFIHPKRTDTNIRYYDDEDLKLVLNVSLLKQKGYRISSIAEMNKSKLEETVREHLNSFSDMSEQINALTIAMIDTQEDHFEQIINKCILKYGFENTMIKLVYPFLNSIGILWLTGAVKPGQEHFITNLIRQKIIVAIDGQYEIAKNADTFILYLPENEWHELGLLFASYLLKSRNQHVVYLGQNLPFNDLEEIYWKNEQAIIMTIITTSPDRSEVDQYVARLSKSFPDTTVLLSGNAVIGQLIEIPNNVIVLNQITDLISYFKK